MDTFHPRRPLLPRGHLLAAILTVALVSTLALGLSLVSAADSATIIVVTEPLDELYSDGDCSLREAIRAANLDMAVDACAAGSGADTIALSTETYELTIANADQTDEDAAETGDLDIVDDLTLMGTDLNETILDGNGIDRVIEVLTGTVMISAVTIQDGNGGGIANAGSLTVIDSAVSDNFAGYRDGPGIYNSGTLSLTNSTIRGNWAPDGSGGGLYNAGRAVVVNSTINSNLAFSGGGILNMRVLTITGSVISANHGVYGVGGISNQGRLAMTGSTILNNAGRSRGGGLANGGSAIIASAVISSNSVVGRAAGSGVGGGIVNGGSLTLLQSTISDNQAYGDEGSAGGGIANYGTISATNSTISGNSADSSGGIASGLGTALLSNVTIANNTARAGGESGGSGGGIGVSPGATAILHNTLLGDNTDASGQAPDCAGTLTSQGYNLVEDATGCTVEGTSTGNVIGQDPRLGELQDNGGPTLTHALLPGTPAIDAGNPAEPGSEENACAAVDQRGRERPTDGDGDGVPACDIGAYEAEAIPPLPTATSTATSMPTATQTATATATQTATATATASPTATRTATAAPSATATTTRTTTPPNTPTATATTAPSSTPTATATPGGATLVYFPVADARVEADRPNANTGHEPFLRVDGGSDPDEQSYLRFQVQGVVGPITRATLRLWATTETGDGPTVHSTGNDWSESRITWRNRPSFAAAPTDGSGEIDANSWVEFDVTSLIAGDGAYSFALVTDTPDGVTFSSREGSQPPMLVLTLPNTSVDRRLFLPVFAR